MAAARKTSASARATLTRASPRLLVASPYPVRSVDKGWARTNARSLCRCSIRGAIVTAARRAMPQSTANARFAASVLFARATKRKTTGRSAAVREFAARACLERELGCRSGASVACNQARAFSGCNLTSRAGAAKAGRALKMRSRRRFALSVTLSASSQAWMTVAPAAAATCGGTPTFKKVSNRWAASCGKVAIVECKGSRFMPRTAACWKMGLMTVAASCSRNGTSFTRVQEEALFFCGGAYLATCKLSATSWAASAASRLS
mmetsp:Transcript_3974/g.12985  ORF Transcript_3974/g.12985 Transcript_3974/m.12985 type:complete len:263 (-) Transcript_3974:5841-6629(-)